MNAKKLYILLALNVLVFLPAIYAQDVFTEGIIKYDVVITPPANIEGVKEYHGTYVVTIKSDNIRKELKMDNGYEDIVIDESSADKQYSVKNLNGKNYAIEIDKSILENRRKPWSDYSVTDKKKLKNIAGTDGKLGTITYKNGESIDLYYTDKWSTHHEIFEYFHNLNFIPLQFTFSNKDGMRMFFEAKQILSTPVENNFFRIPAKYKIITWEEYKKMN